MNYKYEGVQMFRLVTWEEQPTILPGHTLHVFPLLLSFTSVAWASLISHRKHVH